MGRITFTNQPERETRRFWGSLSWPFALLFLLLAGLFLASGCKSKTEEAPKPVAKPTLTGHEKIIFDLIASEDLILDLTPRLGRLANWLEGTSQSGNGLAEDLKTCVEINALAAADPTTVFHTDSQHPPYVEVAHWPIENSPSGKPVNPWAALQSLGVQWETMKFGVVEAHFIDPEQTQFSLHTKVEGRGSSPEGVYGLKGHQELVFALDANTWKLSKWIQEDLFVERCQQALFREVLAEVLRDPESLSHAQRSHKDEIIVESSKRGRNTTPVSELAKWTELPSSHIFPTVSVVDYNNDGHDDVFLTSRWGPTQMLENQGDGTFVDVAKKIGLYQEYMVNCVLFADLDNDGDKDAIMGRPMETAIYYRNEDGQFKNVTAELSDLGDQYFISAISASDVNRDGLLDIYLSNYPPLGKENAYFENQFLTAEEKVLFLSKKFKGDPWLNQIGSANVLLMNRGNGRLERFGFDDVLAQWRRSFQAIWSDIDDDGDDDLYICNDFAPDALLRNDTPRGADQPVFVDITSDSLMTNGMGFGMGGSFGDFDSDGDFDIYVSNMFSKAGRRIVKQVETVDPRIESAAAGSFLLVNNGGVFEQKAGSSPDQFHVNQVGWSYGGQWADLNNDSELDLYVPTGFYTAPKQIDTAVDN